MAAGQQGGGTRQAIAAAEAIARTGSWNEALDAYAAAIAQAGDGVASAPARADACRGAAVVRMKLGSWREAIADAVESRRIADLADDDRRIALAENLLGAIAFESGDWHEAGRRYGAAREHAGSAGDEPLLLEIENNDGVLWAAIGDRPRAEESFRWALSRFEELERHPCGARVMNNLGMVLAAEGRFDEAGALYERALVECKRRSDVALGTTVMVNRARLALAQNDVLKAHALVTTAEVFCHRLPDNPLNADIACLMGAVARTLHNWSRAETSLRRALEQSSGGRAPLAEAESWAELGELFSAQDQSGEAADAWRTAARCYRHLGAVADAERVEAAAESARQSDAEAPCT